jgi:GTP cyclohydrolase I
MMNHKGNGNGDKHDEHTAVDRKLKSKNFLATFELNFPPVNDEQIEAAVEDILVAVGEDPQREGLVDTPRRVARAYTEMLSGYRTDPAALLNNALFDVDYDDMVIVKDIEFASLCEHHMLPFVGHAHVAYIPNGKVVGLSKIPRIVDMFAQRLQVQERMTRQIAAFISEVLNPVGVGVVVEGVHMCSMIRGVEKHDTSMTTSAMLGTFREKSKTRNEFLSHLNRARSRHSGGF